MFGISYTVYNQCMPNTAPYERHTARYDSWFDNHRSEYESELAAVRSFVPSGGVGIEIGVGTARFAEPLGVSIGIDPSLAMLSYAARRGIRCVSGVAEAVPFRDEQFDYALMVTALCVFEDPAKAIAEAYRVIKKGGCFVAGFLDSSSRQAAEYIKRYASSPFSEGANFPTAADVEGFLKSAGFQNTFYVQTLFNPLEKISEPEALAEGRGDGLFVVVKAVKV